MGEQKGKPLDFETIVRRVMANDRRYAPEAYVFLNEALRFTQAYLGKDSTSDVAEERHVSGQELVEGIRRLAEEEFGWLAPMVLRGWGLRGTEDFGEMVFNLVEAGGMLKTSRDTRADFAGGFDFDEAFRRTVKL